MQRLRPTLAPDETRDIVSIHPVDRAESLVVHLVALSAKARARERGQGGGGEGDEGNQEMDGEPRCLAFWPPFRCGPDVPPPSPPSPPSHPQGHRLYLACTNGSEFIPFCVREAPTQAAPAAPAPPPAISTPGLYAYNQRIGSSWSGTVGWQVGW